jgi:MOSC domain-containing protein YiiM
MIIEDILTGTIQTYKKDNGESFKSSYIRKPIESNSILLTKNGFQDVADLKNHGGKNKGILIFSREDYNNFEIGTFSENLILSHFDKTFIKGAKFQIGEAIIEITKPREPCWKVAYFYGKEALKYMVDSKKTGIYANILQEGIIHKGDKLKLI